MAWQRSSSPRPTQTLRAHVRPHHRDQPANRGRDAAVTQTTPVDHHTTVDIYIAGRSISRAREPHPHDRSRCGICGCPRHAPRSAQARWPAHALRMELVDVQPIHESLTKDSHDGTSEEFPSVAPDTAKPSADIEAAQALAAERSALVLKQFGDGLPFDLPRYEHVIRTHLARSADEMLAAGRALLVVREHVPHGIGVISCPVSASNPPCAAHEPGGVEVLKCVDVDAFDRGRR